MGLKVYNLPVLNGIAFVDESYVIARDINLNKNNEGKHTIAFDVYYFKNTRFFHKDKMQKELSNGPNGDIWDFVYDIIKKQFDTQNIKYENI